MVVDKRCGICAEKPPLDGIIGCLSQRPRYAGHAYHPQSAAPKGTVLPTQTRSDSARFPEFPRGSPGKRRNQFFRRRSRTILYMLYRYKTYRDVRLVFAPESKAATFGGTSTTSLTRALRTRFSLLRVYEDGMPLRPEHHLRLADKPPAAVIW